MTELNKIDRYNYPMRERSRQNKTIKSTLEIIAKEDYPEKRPIFHTFSMSGDTYLCTFHTNDGGLRIEIPSTRVQGKLGWTW